MEIVLTSFYSLLFALIIRKAKFFSAPGLSNNTVAGIFLLKVMFGILLWYTYTYYYTNKAENDIYKFFDDAKYIYAAIKTNPLHYLQLVFGINSEAVHLKPYLEQTTHWYKPWPGSTFHDNNIIIQFNALVYLFSQGYFNVHTVFMSFISLLGLMCMYKTFVVWCKGKTNLLLAAIFLVPSVLFWSSGVLKEGLLITGLGVVLYSLHNLLNKDNLVLNTIFLLLGGYFVFQTKMYVFAALLPALLFVLIVLFTGKQGAIVKFIVIHVLLVILAFNLYRINSAWDIVAYLHLKQMGFIQTAISEQAGSYIDINYLENSTISLINNVPSAVINVLFRPFITEASSLPIYAAAMETAVFSIFSVFALFFFKKPSAQFLPMVLAITSFILILVTLIGLLTPLLGSIVRFRMPFVPLYAAILVGIIDFKKLLNFLVRLLPLSRLK